MSLDLNHFDLYNWEDNSYSISMMYNYTAVEMAARVCYYYRTERDDHYFVMHLINVVDEFLVPCPHETIFSINHPINSILLEILQQLIVADSNTHEYCCCIEHDYYL